MSQNTNSIFGQTQASGAGSLFGATSSKEGNGTNAFSFGNSSTPAFGAKTDAAKPSFSFGAPSNTADASKPAASFSFGGAANANAAPSSFSFGAPAAAAPAEKKDDKPAFSFGGTSAAPTANGASNTFAFGAKPAETKPAAAAPAFSFGGAKADDKPASTPFAFGGAKPEEKKDSAPATGGMFGNAAPAPSFSFGAAKPEEKKASTPAFSFGGAKTEEKKADAVPSFSLGGAKPTEAAKPAAATVGGLFGTPKPDEKKAAPAFSFGGAKTEEKKEDKPAFSLGGAKPSEAAKPTEASKPAGFSFGAPQDVKKDDKPAALSFGVPAGDQKDEEKEKKTVSFSSSVIDRDEKKEAAKTVEPQPVSLNNKTLEDLITKWTSQLTKSSASFQSYSSKINEWDRVLVDGGEKISQLYTDVVAAEQTQNKIEQQLLYVERQQSELETFLDNYETKAENLLSEVLASNNNQRDSSVVTNDQKREQAYRTAELLDENLNSLGLNLSSLIGEINEVSDSFNKANGLGGSKDNASQEDDNTLYQIVKLLNTHLDALNRIQKNSDEVNSKLDQFKGFGL